MSTSSNISQPNYSPSEPETPQVLKLIYQSLRYIIKSAVATEWNGTKGTCNQRIYSDKQSLNNSFNAPVGQKDLIEAIKSNQGACVWRVLTGERVLSKMIAVNNTSPEVSSLLLEKKMGIEVTHPINFDKVYCKQTIILPITNRSNQVQFLNKWVILRKMKNSHMNIETDKIPLVLKPHCATLELAIEGSAKSNYEVQLDSINVCCGQSFMERQRVTIGTFITLGTLTMMAYPKDHFTHIIVDEAGQEKEPEIMIAITFTNNVSGQIIQAGYPMQLGPVVTLHYARELAMGESYLCRLLETFPYQKVLAAFKNGFKNIVTKLNDYYRSQKEVIMLQGQIFYDDSLVPKIDRSQPWIEKIVMIINKLLDLGYSDSTGGISKVHRSFVGNTVRFYDKLPGKATKLPVRRFKAYIKNNLIKKAYYTINDYIYDRTAWPDLALPPVS